MSQPVKAEYSIAAVSKLTGVSCHTLRIWERRYGFPVPHRSASGHRRYSAEQAESLRMISQMLKAGRSIGELIDELNLGSVSEGVEPPPVLLEPGPAPLTSPAGQLVDVLARADIESGESLFERWESELSPLEFITRIAEPVLVETGERWFRRELDVFQEHLITASLFRRLGRMLDQVRRANPSPKHLAVVGTVQGERHEGGVLMLSIGLELMGWRALTLGVDLPTRDYTRAVETWRPDALALSFVLSRSINKRFSELSKLTGVPVFVGGRSIVNHQGLARRYGLIPLTGALTLTLSQFLSEYEDWCREHRPDLGDAGSRV